ncbi:sensor histidine kinase [Micromonospora sp. NPDC049497]|uniref:sensor histidine kinase n=1 Tax=Micromonospora sp. NPDC049497 TaxID=3364273 RepID=UPI0037B20F0D
MATIHTTVVAPAKLAYGLREWFTADRRRGDWAAAICLLAVAALTMTGPGTDLTATDQVVAGTGSLVQAAVLLVRRRLPLFTLAASTAVLVATVAIIGDPIATEVGVAFAVYAVAVDRAPSVTWVAWVTVLVVSWLTYLAALRIPAVAPATTRGQALLTAVLGVLLATLVALALGLTVRGRRVQVTALEERAQRLALERDQREQLAAATERTRMAREMHDVVAHSVAVMVTLAHGAAAAFDKRPERSREALAEISSTGRTALRDMRRIVGVLREDSGQARETAGGPAAVSAPDDVATLVKTFQEVGLPARLVERGPALPRDFRLRHTLYRVVQECLTNVLRHAPYTSCVEVTLDRSDQSVTATVSNTGGTAGPVASGSGYGLAGMRERVAVHRGTVEAGPTPDGWRVRVTLQYDQEVPS